MTEGNGSPVTWRELNLALAPLRDGHKEIVRKIDALVETVAENRGAEKASRGFLDSKWRVISTAVVILTSTIGTTIFTFVLRSHTQ